MLSLEEEYARLRASGEISEERARNLIAVDRAEVFSLHYELRVLLYAAVSLIVAGVGLYLKRNLYRIGPGALISGLLLVAAACYAFVWLRRRRSSLAHDYLLLLAALLSSAALGYAEAQFHMLDGGWSWHLLLLAVFHGLTSYLYRSRILLSVSITSLAAFFGIQGNLHLDLYAGPDLAVRMFACASVLFGWRLAHINVVAREGGRWSGLETFVDVFDHAIALLSLAGSLLLVFDPWSRWIGVLALGASVFLVLRFGWSRRLFTFVVYGVLAAMIGCGHLMVTVVRYPSVTLLYFLLSTIAAIVALFLAWRKLREEE